MKFGVVNKSTILNRIVFYTLQRNITRLAVITRKTNIKLGILKGKLEKSPIFHNKVCFTVLYSLLSNFRGVGKEKRADAFEYLKQEHFARSWALFHFSPHLNFSFGKLNFICHIVMKICTLNNTNYF